MSQHSRRRLTVLAGLLVVLATADLASAQRGRGFRRTFGVPKAQLASLPEVQTELKLNDEQKTRVAELDDELREKRRELLNTGFGKFSEIRGKLEQNSAEASANVDKLLDPAQRKRLQEISIQQNGLRALGDAAVVAELGLSDEQKTKLTAAFEENNQAFEKAFSESGNDWRQKAGELADAADKRLLGILTDAQKAKFEQMKGAAFDVDLSPFFRGGGGGR